MTTTLSERQIKLAVAKSLKERGIKTNLKQRRAISFKVMMVGLDRHFGFENMPRSNLSNDELLAALNA